MSLKNRNETKLLMENWRKVLKEGLYDEDPELLEEGLTEMGLTSLAALVALAPSVSQAKIPGESEKDQNRATIGLTQRAQEIAQHEDMDRFAKSEKIEEIMEIISKIKSSEDKNLNFLQKQIYKKEKEAAKKQIEEMKDNYRRAKQEVKDKSDALKALAEPETLGTGEEHDIAIAKSELETALDNLDFAAFGLKKLFQIPGSVEVRMDKNNKFLGVGGERIYSKTRKPTITPRN